jgi:hypothetical protein
MAHEPPWIDLMASSTVKSLRRLSAVNTPQAGDAFFAAHVLRGPRWDADRIGAHG